MRDWFLQRVLELSLNPAGARIHYSAHQQSALPVQYLTLSMMFWL